MPALHPVGAGGATAGHHQVHCGDATEIQSPVAESRKAIQLLQGYQDIGSLKNVRMHFLINIFEKKSTTVIILKRILFRMY